jgi:hypothetical protein
VELSFRRLGPWMAIVVLIVVGSVTMAVSGLPSNPAPASARAVPPSGGGVVFGVDYADQLPEESGSALAHSLDDAVAVGANWIRIDLAWYRIQTRPGSWDWSSFDRAAAAAKARGLKILAILDQPPAWARDHRCSAQVWCPPADDTQFAAFAARAAQRYPADVVSAWEVWNEENLPSFWNGGPDPAAYDALLKATVIAVKAVQPRAQIVLGGLAVGSGGSSLSAEDFLLAVARLGGLAYVNAIGYHPYSFPTLPAAAKPFADISTGSDSLAAILDRYDAASVGIWLTETGAPVDDAPADPNAVAVDTRLEERQQAAYVTDLVSVATHNPRVKALFWFSDIDLPEQRLYYGLRRADGTARPSLTAFAQAIHASAG